MREGCFDLSEKQVLFSSARMEEDWAHRETVEDFSLGGREGKALFLGGKAGLCSS